MPVILPDPVSLHAAHPGVPGSHGVAASLFHGCAHRNGDRSAAARQFIITVFRARSFSMIGKEADGSERGY